MGEGGGIATSFPGLFPLKLGGAGTRLGVGSISSHFESLCCHPPPCVARNAGSDKAGNRAGGTLTRFFLSPIAFITYLYRVFFAGA